jgi:hypothetical protein
VIRSKAHKALDFATVSAWQQLFFLLLIGRNIGPCRDVYIEYPQTLLNLAPSVIPRWKMDIRKAERRKKREKEKDKREGGAVAIYRLLKEFAIDPQTASAMMEAYEEAYRILELTGSRTDQLTELVAQKNRGDRADRGRSRS